MRQRPFAWLRIRNLQISSVDKFTFTTMLLIRTVSQTESCRFMKYAYAHARRRLKAVSAYRTLTHKYT